MNSRPAKKASISLFRKLEEISNRPKPFEFYTADELWTNSYTSAQMLKYHLNENIDVSSRRISFIESSVEWIKNRFRIGPKSRIADYGCGPGLYSSRLAKLGARVTGIDFSKRSIEYAEIIAKKENLSVRYINENYLNFETNDEFDLIIMIMCDYCALSPIQRTIMLKKFRKQLVNGGFLLLDVYSLSAFEKRKEQSLFEENLRDGFWAEDKYYVFQNTFKYEDLKVVLDKYTIITEKESKVVYNWLQYFDFNILKDEFSACGLEIIEKYADVAGNEYRNDGDEFAVIANKQ